MTCCKKNPNFQQPKPPTFIPDEDPWLGVQRALRSFESHHCNLRRQLFDTMVERDRYRKALEEIYEYHKNKGGEMGGEQAAYLMSKDALGIKEKNDYGV